MGKTPLKNGKDGINRSPWESPLALFQLILFALERSEQRPGEPPAAALPPARPRRAPLLSPDGAAAPGTDLRGEQEQSGAGMRLPDSRQGVRSQQCKGCTRCRGCKPAQGCAQNIPEQCLVLLPGWSTTPSQRGAELPWDHCRAVPNWAAPSLFQITVYDQENFQGKRMEFTSACPNIMECGFDNIRSLKVECGA